MLQIPTAEGRQANPAAMISTTFCLPRHMSLFRTCAIAAALLFSPFSQSAALADDFAIEGAGFVTAADVRQHNRLPLDLAYIREALAKQPADFDAALSRYAYGGGFKWRDAHHSLAFFADDYQGRMTRTLPGATALFENPNFAHLQITAALMGTSEFRGSGQSRALPEEYRRAFAENALLATILNWCRLELSEASIRGPQNGNWSLQNGSPKNWSELFAFWWGPEGQHSLHAEMERISTDLALPKSPTLKVTEPLAAGQPEIVAERWPQEIADEVKAALDYASLLLVVDRLEALKLATDEADRMTALFALKGVWVAGSDAFARADMAAAEKVQAAFKERNPDQVIAAFVDTLPTVLAALSIDAAELGHGAQAF